MRYFVSCGDPSRQGTGGENTIRTRAIEQSFRIMSVLQNVSILPRNQGKPSSRIALT